MIYILDMGGSTKDTTSKKKKDKDRDKTDVHREIHQSYDNHEHHEHHEHRSKISKKNKVFLNMYC